MKKRLIIKLIVVIAVLFFVDNSYAQNPVNWTSNQLVEPSALADTINAKKDLPVIISVGPGAVIPNSIHAGMASETAGLNRLKTQLKDLPKDRKIIIYCGCCPFEHCPNVRPAINVLKAMNFTNYYLLNLPDNIKKDWIDKGYPILESE
ncbi:rhodanese-like domain-containing protein [Ilyomonas limi]|uniref:Rhodanese-like domain-containing protein n=1 Tax=Ilyomonas limi TaxID=2575867 RepID=A0A4U3KWW3_9BACT|nr:rhodanese-like domain-containing protein [Ilyomonas limi]TKK66910.1 rhodanese-like domain-containing protein [Ilyomonas limi]